MAFFEDSFEISKMTGLELIAKNRGTVHIAVSRFFMFPSLFTIFPA
ncbi:conserved hypothetical protein [Streptococcus equi subsp. zooepidemicus ATCC 35246]|nr:conserved hypothetical protein [Streptococcus equi subsp. zooepidemicus ATCC 35246]